jgi:hypothetical protein
MTEEGNYNRYKGGPGQKGENENTILGQIKQLMKNIFLEHRKKDSIGAKISNIEGQIEYCEDKKSCSIGGKCG